MTFYFLISPEAYEIVLVASFVLEPEWGLLFLGFLRDSYGYWKSGDAVLGASSVQNIGIVRGIIQIQGEGSGGKTKAGDFPILGVARLEELWFFLIPSRGIRYRDNGKPVTYGMFEIGPLGDVNSWIYSSSPVFYLHNLDVKRGTSILLDV